MTDASDNQAAMLRATSDGLMLAITLPSSSNGARLSSGWRSRPPARRRPLELTKEFLLLRDAYAAAIEARRTKR